MNQKEDPWEQRFLKKTGLAAVAAVVCVLAISGCRP